MPNPSINSAVINKTDSGFPDYLDFDVLRASSIKYLSGLTGKVWTDYNVHDPGITILEVLIYALLDLGYRTNFPATDIFAKNPTEKSEGDDNFFTPAQILSCNPLTILDYRKMLIDIDGVKNAWLEVAKDVSIQNPCPSTEIKPITTSLVNPIIEPDFINGLYHITLQLNEFSLRPQGDIIADVKNSLLSHRNLCEDFFDVSVLNKLEIGICADIGLDANADANEVCKNIMLALETFFSPAPQFYTLQQLLEKGKKIEDIFAGRPYNVKTSHGFVDTDEFEALTQKKEIHLSDVYNVILSLNGVDTVRKLKLKQNDKLFDDKWLFTVPDGYASVFSMDISSVRFSVNGIIVPVDFQQVIATVKTLSVNSNKLPQLSGNIDLNIPQGTYRNDLADYYSIQNEFPLVYGIGEGGLPESAPLQRKIQALQLKGYLLFFDQLLADYLTQLSNIRNVFSLRSPDKNGGKTYFFNPLNNNPSTPGYVPDFAKLLQNVTDDNGVSAAGNNGSILGYPVWKSDFDKLKNQPFSTQDLKKLQQAFQFNTQNEYKVIVSLLQNSFANNEQDILTSKFSTSDNFFFYAIGFSTIDVVLTGLLYVNDSPQNTGSSVNDAAALKAIGLLQDMAIIPNSYKSYHTGEDGFSFNIELDLPTYATYLQQIKENKALYQKRRGGFLDHLLSRFAERFTDFALLSYNTVPANKLPDLVIKNKENFLSQYPLLSSTRGQAFNYKSTAADNFSGFEKRFRAYTGIDTKPTSTLCNFEVVAYDETYAVQLKLGDFDLFKTTGIYEGKENALDAVQAIFSSLSVLENYKVALIQHEAKYQLQVVFNNDIAFYKDLFAIEQDAIDMSINLQKMFGIPFSDENIITTQNEYRLELKDNEGKIIRVSTDVFSTDALAFVSSISNLQKPDDVSKWQIVSPENKLSGKFCTNDKKRPEKLIDIDAFKIDINNNIVGKPDKFNYELLDKKNNFKFRSLNEFNSDKQARADAYRLLMLMVDKKNYGFLPDKKKRVFVFNNGQPVAECLNKIEDSIAGGEFIDTVCGIINNHFYILSATPFASRWKFNYRLGFEKDADLVFESDTEYDNLETTKSAMAAFSGTLQNANLEVINGKYALTTTGTPTANLTCTHVGAAIETLKEDEKLNKAKHLLELSKTIDRNRTAPVIEDFKRNIQVDEISNTGAFVYRLVDKDNLYAWAAFVDGKDEKEQINQLYRNELSGYKVPEICLGGDITEAFKDAKTKALLYRYVIKCHNSFGVFMADTILFKSVAVYTSVADAEAAFNNNYLIILGKAMLAENYGDGKFISLVAPTNNTGFKEKSEAIVFVPEDTQKFITDAGKDIVKTLVEAASSYPIRQTPENAFAFALHNVETASDDWQSVNIYNNVQQARQAFYFFTMLLKYKGNYYVGKDDDGNPKIYLREVLAESKHRFTNKADAWRKTGIENFICISQSAGAFHAAVNTSNCSYTFDVSCNSQNGIHPCKYDSPERRDNALEKLFTAFKGFDVTNLFKIINENGTEIIYGIDGNKVAILNKDEKEQVAKSDCERILEVLTLAGDDGNYKKEGQKVVIQKVENEKNIKLAETINDNIPQPAWKKQLLLLACYFPIKLNNEKYCVEIKLPSFNAPDIETDKNCGCKAPIDEKEGTCYVAWKSGCYYEKCSEAMEKYASLISQLTNYNNYRPYFDCTCYAYGIALQPLQNITAYCPQQYTSPEMVCDAIERSKKLINREGLYLVEHILLRPRSKPVSQNNILKPANLFKETNCNNWFWEEEVFTKGENILTKTHFAPGEDPFSFIATVVLPAWPQRFRIKENRDLLEMILYRETPSHILLRILWLNPQDTCRFETVYKTWKTAFVQTPATGFESANIDLKNFLFTCTLNNLSDCEDCLPCAQNTASVSCLDDTAKNVEKSTDNGKPITIQSIFGWNEKPCDDNNVVLNDTSTQPPTVSTEKVITQKGAQLINARLAVYKQNVAQIYTDSNENPLAERANYILKEKDFPIEKITALLDDLINADENNPIEKAQKDGLIKNLIWFYLDKMLFETEDIADLQLITDKLTKIRTRGFDMQLLFEDWKSEDLEKVKPASVINEIQQALIKN